VDSRAGSENHVDRRLLYAADQRPDVDTYIIDSFTQIGQNSSGVASISPSNVFAQGLNVAGALSNGFSVAGFLTQPRLFSRWCSQPSSW